MIELLSFELNRQRFGIVLTAVREVVRAVALAHLPGAPPVVEGAINLRGAIIPVLDIRGRFGLTPKPIEISDHFIIAHANSRLIGLRADRVADVLEIESAAITDAKAAALPSPYVSGVAKLADGLLVIHDLATFLTAAESARLDQVADATA